MSDFERRKLNCLGKLDKSSAGRIDAKAVEICGAINNLPDFYTTSSCAGRTHLWRGVGYKGTQGKRFERFRVNHDLIDDVDSYFDLNVSETSDAASVQSHDSEPNGLRGGISPWAEQSNDLDIEADGTLWLRCEPFILHVCCRTLKAAHALVSVSRAAFKNVGLQSWKDEKYMVSVWGDDGLDMPLTAPGTQGKVPLFPETSQKEWIKAVVNGKHQRNWGKIDKLVEVVRKELAGLDFSEDVASTDQGQGAGVPRHFDVIGDVALLHELPQNCATIEEKKELGEAVLKTNRRLKVCAVRCGKMEGDTKRVDLEILAGHVRTPLLTTHYEYGVGYIVNVGECFFSPRMGLERLRLCNSISRGEVVCCLFSGCAAEALQIAVKTEVAKVVAVEMNSAAVACARKGVEALRGRNKAKNPEAAAKIELIEGDVASVLPSMQHGSFDRIVAPRPKGADPGVNGGGGDGGLLFLRLLLPLLKAGAECHWYDFAGKQELQQCARTTQFLVDNCLEHGLQCDILYVGKAGKKSIAAGQYRICVDFRVRPISVEAKQTHGTDIVKERMMNHTAKRQWAE